MNRKKTQIKKAKNPARSVHIPTTRCVSLNAKYVHFDNTHIENVCHTCFGIGCASVLVREWEHECESRLKIKDLCSIVFYVRLVKWSFFFATFSIILSMVCVLVILRSARAILSMFSWLFWFFLCDVMLLIVTYCLPCSLISFISIIVLPSICSDVWVCVCARVCVFVWVNVYWGLLPIADNMSSCWGVV